MKALLLLASLSIFSDTTITSQLPAHSHRVEQVAIDSGRKWNVEAFVYYDMADLTCTFSHLGQTLSKQEHTYHCSLLINTDFPVYVQVDVQNNESHSITYHVQSSFQMPLK